MTPRQAFADLPWWARATWWVRQRVEHARRFVAAKLVSGLLTVAQRVLAQFRFKLALLALTDVLGFLINWLVIWLLIWWLAPTLIVGSAPGASALLQAIPTTIVAIYVLVLGSLFVVAQVLISSHGQRAALLLTGRVP